MGPEEQLPDQWQQMAVEQQQLRILLAQVSRQLLSNQAVEQYFSDTEAKFFKNADERDLSDTAGRDRAYFCISVLRGLKKYIEYCANEQPDAEAQLNKLISGRR